MGDRENYFQAKALLFTPEHSATASWMTNGVADGGVSR